jgi:hypothetical protein
MSDVTTAPVESAQLDCPECRASITYYDVAGSEYYACPACHTFFRQSGEEPPKVYGKYLSEPDEITTRLLPVGTPAYSGASPAGWWAAPSGRKWAKPAGSSTNGWNTSCTTPLRRNTRNWPSTMATGWR